MTVMNVKRGTQNFSKAEQTSSMKNDVPNANAIADFKAAYGDQSMGDVLNRASDPNWVDPAKKVRAVGNNELGKDAFLKLMLANMKNQDPTKPMESHEMAAQLAQFTSLEQLNNINTTLESMKNAQSPSTNYQALAFIGKKISGDSSKLTRGAGDTKHSFNFQLMGDSAKGIVSIKDAGGNVVRKMEVGALKKGQNSVEWNGINEEGMPARAGEYKFSIDSVNSSGAKVYAKTEFGGRITGLNYGSDGPVLLVGNQSVKLSDVKKIEDAGPDEAMMAKPLESAAGAAPMGGAPMIMAPKVKAEKPAAQQHVSAAKPKGPPSTEAAANGEIPPAPPAEDAQSVGNINDVPMSRELLNQLAKAH
jgi:flagellar basal-body rod modification protein FlgD